MVYICRECLYRIAYISGRYFHDLEIRSSLLFWRVLRNWVLLGVYKVSCAGVGFVCKLSIMI